MALSAEEIRVLACLIEKAATVPDSYPLTLNALRPACNQTSNRHPVVRYQDGTVETALTSLKSIGLVRFVHPSHGGRTVRYRHVADERWQLEPNELAVLATLALRGPQTAAEVRARTERGLEVGGPSVEDALDTLAARDPAPFVVELARSPGEREPRWAHLLGGTVDEAELGPADPPARAAGETDLAAEVAALRRRLDRLEQLLGVEGDIPPSADAPASPPA